LPWTTSSSRSTTAATRLSVFLLDAACQVIDVHTAAVDPYDPEDLAVAADGTVWLADTGDNDAIRTTVALIALRPDGSTSIYRLTYPDGPHDAEALLLAPDGTPYLVTKELLGASGVYGPMSALVDGGTVAAVKVAAVNVTFTGTAGGPVGQAGQLLVTGGAVARDGSALALRTYTDAYVWPLVGSDVPAALAAARCGSRSRLATGRGDQLRGRQPEPRGRQRRAAERPHRRARSRPRPWPR
jgi:hypothetical protein